ncbi:MAG: hypothetical protein ACI8PT_003297 [Gammaproteobacteria bacterium]
MRDEVSPQAHFERGIALFDEGATVPQSQAAIEGEERNVQARAI